MPAKSVFAMLGLLPLIVSAQKSSQNNEMVGLLHSFEASAIAGTPRSFDEADPVLQRFTTVDKGVAAQALPVLVGDVTSPYVSVRRLVSMALLAVSMRSDGNMLLSSVSTSFSPLLNDQDLSIRRVTGIALGNLTLDSGSNWPPVMEAYLVRSDAVTTIGPALAVLLLKTAPNNPESINAVVRFMERRTRPPQARLTCWMAFVTSPGLKISRLEMQ